MGYMIVDAIAFMAFCALAVVYFIGDASEFIFSLVFLGFALFFLDDLITRIAAYIDNKNDSC